MRAFRLPALRRRAWMAFALAALLIGAATLAALTLLGSDRSDTIILLGLASIAIVALLGLALDRLLLVPLTRVTSGALILERSNPGHRLEVDGRHWLDSLPEAVQRLGERIGRSEAELEKAVSSWSAELEERKARLETVVRALHEGILVCDADGRLLLYNDAARQLLRDQPALGLGRSVFEILNRPPLEHSLEILRQGDDRDRGGARSGGEFVCATARTGRLLRCQLALLPATVDGFVLTLEDLSSPTRELLRRERILRERVERLRDPIASLRAASESAQAADRAGMEDMRRRFDAIVHDEAPRLAEGFRELCEEAQSVLTGSWRLADIHSDDLIGSVLRRPREELPQVAVGGRPQWLRAEGYLIGQVLAILLEHLAEDHDVESTQIIPSIGDEHVYLDLKWAGDPVPATRIAGWLQTPLADAGGTVSVAEVLERHDSTIWSRMDPEKPDHALLRIPLPMADAHHDAEDPLPPRPEFYDFSLGQRGRPLGALAQRSLDTLDYVVFDTETTGLEPSAGDEIIAIGAVRVTAGRIRTGETFEQLVNPGRPIPESSTRFHGITDGMVATQPDLDAVLPRFRDFVGDAVLVAHNAAFDMRFLKLRERRSGVRFDSAVLDTLLLSILIHDQTPDHALEAIARRLGVAVAGRHTAMGDAMTTAGIFVQLLKLLPENDITSLGDAVAACERMVEYRRQQRAF